jgi:hypothetical protein
MDYTMRELDPRSLSENAALEWESGDEVGVGYDRIYRPDKRGCRCGCESCAQNLGRQHERDTDHEGAFELEWEEATRPRACKNDIPRREPIRQVAVTPSKVLCRNPVRGVTQPFGINPLGKIRAAATRAVAMLDNTIRQLLNARTAVCRGTTPAAAPLSAVARDWLRNRLSVCIDNPRVWTAGTFVNGSVAEVIRRLVRVRNLIARNELLYICNPAPCGSEVPCDPGTWAFTCLPADHAGNCLPGPAGTPRSIIRLCRPFWEPARLPSPPNPPGSRVAVPTHAEFQAQTIIHEASHLTHCTEDKIGRTIGVAECLAQFVAATNNSPLDPGFDDRCARTNRCDAADATLNPEMSGLAGPGRPARWIVAKTRFRPQNAIRFPGRRVA